MNERIKELLHLEPAGQQVEVHGWVRTCRDSGNLCFVELTDGSCLTGLQIIAEANLENYAAEVRTLSTGTAVRVVGTLVESPAKGQAVEVRAEQVTVLGQADPATYPLQKKRHSFEFLRSICGRAPMPWVQLPASVLN